MGVLEPAHLGGHPLHGRGADRGNGDGTTADDVALVQDALERVMGVAPDDPHSVFEAETQELFERFRKEKLDRYEADGHGVPTTRELVELGHESALFNVRAGSSPARNRPGSV